MRAEDGKTSLLRSEGPALCPTIAFSPTQRLNACWWASHRRHFATVLGPPRRKVDGRRINEMHIQVSPILLHASGAACTCPYDHISCQAMLAVPADSVFLTKPSNNSQRKKNRGSLRACVSSRIHVAAAARPVYFPNRGFRRSC